MEPDPNRLWKRVRTLESSLGYSNLAFEGAVADGPILRGTRNRRWKIGSFDLPRHHRKRRLPAVGISSGLQVSAPHRGGVRNSSSVPALVLPSEEHSDLPLTRSVSQHAGEGYLPRLPGQVAQTRSNRALEGPQKNMCVYTDAATLEERRQLVQVCQSLPGGAKGTAVGLSSGRLLEARYVEKSAEDQALAEPDCVDDLLAGPEGNVSMSLCDDLQPTPGFVGDAYGYQPRKTPRDRGIALKMAGNEKQQSFALRTLPSGKKLRPFRVGRCRSLVSPTNQVFSSTVVARVKEGLQSGHDEQRPKVLIVGSGTFNPIHKIHIRRFYLARNFLQAHKGMRVVGGILSPSHPTLVRQRHRVRAAEIIPPKHRLYMARAAVGEGSWLAVDPWEVTRKRIMDYMSVLEHAREVCHETFPGQAGDITVLYMCQPSKIHHLNPAMLRAGGFGVITVCRPLEKASLLKELSPSFRNIAILVEDSTILSADLEKTSSNMVRHFLKQGKSVEGMVGKAVARYIRDNAIAERVSGRKKWTVEERAFMFDQDEKKDRPYHNLPRAHVRRASQMPLQM